MYTSYEFSRPRKTRPARELLPAWLFETLRNTFSPLRLNYIANVLTRDELAVIRDLHDALIIARIKKMPHWRIEKFDRLVPADDAQQCLYRSLQMSWLRDEEYLLGTRLGRSPTQKELFIDFMNNHNGLRFRAYFALKFPERMKALNSVVAHCCAN